MRTTFVTFLFFAFSTGVFSQNSLTTKNGSKMKLNAGIVTSKLEETRKFYTEQLGFGVSMLS